MTDARKYVQGIKYRLYGSGIGLSDTSIRLTSMTLPNSGELVTMTMFGDKGYATIEPGNRSREENISFTGITQNVDGSATLTGVTRGLELVDPYTQDLTLRKSHAGGVVISITNSSAFYSDFANKYNDETIVGKYTFPDTPGVDRPVLESDTNAVLAEELITKGELNRAITATFLTPTIVNTSSATTGTSTATSLTWSHVSSGNDRLLLVEVSTEQDKTITGITYNGDALTQAVAGTRVTGDLRTEIWYRIAPDLGTNNIVISMSAAAYISATALTINSAHQTTPIGITGTADGSSTTPSVAVTTTQVNSILIDSLATENDPTTFTAGANQSIQQSIESAATRQIATSVEGTTSTGSYTMSYTISPTGNWAISTVEIKGVAGGGGGGGDNYTVKATNADTTPNYLDDKISLVSTDGSVTITKTINNPAGNEDIEYDLSAMLSGGGGGTKIAIDTTQKTNGDSYTISIPGGTLDTNNAIRFRVYLSTLNFGPAGDATIDATYGGSAVGAQLNLSNTSTMVTGKGAYLEGIIVANGATNAQKGVVTISTLQNLTTTVGFDNEYSSIAVDSTVDQNLVVTLNVTGATITAQAIVVEKITDGSEITEKKVGVGEIGDVNWFNTQYQFYGPDSANSAYSIWDMTSMTTSISSNGFTRVASQNRFLNNTTDYDALLPDFDDVGNGFYKFDSTKQLIAQWAMRAAAVSAQNLGGIGFCEFGTADAVSAQGSTSVVAICFTRKDSDGQWYAHVSDASAMTETAVTITDDVPTVCRIEYDPNNPTPQARFYVDGTLVATITTNLPTASTVVVGFAGGNGTNASDTAINAITCPSFAVEI